MLSVRQMHTKLLIPFWFQLVFDTTWFSPFFAVYVFGAWFFIYSMRDQKKCAKVRGRRDVWQPAKFLKTDANASLMVLILRDLILKTGFQHILIDLGKQSQIHSTLPLLLS